jgi:hypothetical protein
MQTVLVYSNIPMLTFGCAPPREAGKLISLQWISRLSGVAAEKARRAV